MRITFFGSSHGVPEPNRRCSSILLEVGENSYFIDVGTEPIPQLVTRNIPITSVKAVFVTHMHGDHTNGLPSLLDLCTWYYKHSDIKIFLPGDLEASVAAVTAWLKCNSTLIAPFDFCNVTAGVIFEDECIKVTAIKTMHIADSYAYLVEAEGRRVLFTGDLRNPKEDFPIAVLEKPTDLVICEAAHFPASLYEPIFDGNKNLKMVCFNHYINAQMQSMLDVKKAIGPIPVMLATDGTEIAL